MAIQKKEFGVMPSGEKVYEYTLTNKSGVSASFIELGATRTKMLVPDRDLSLIHISEPTRLDGIAFAVLSG